MKNTEIKEYFAGLREEARVVSYTGALDSLENRSKNFIKKFDDPSIKSSLRKKAMQEYAKTLKTIAKRRKQLK